MEQQMQKIGPMSPVNLMLIKTLFTQREMAFIINALYRRANDTSTCSVDGDGDVRNYCYDLANQLMKP